MKILLISSTGFVYTPKARYAGIERLVWEYSKELVKSHEVYVIAAQGSEFPQDVSLLSAPPYLEGEIKAHQTYCNLYRQFDIIHDFSHLHLASRFMDKLPSLNIFWHAPSLAKYPKAPYNIIAPSNWAAREFMKVYHQKARYQNVILIDPEVYHPEGMRGERFLTMGRMSPEKGNLTAIQLCLKAGVPLDVVGGRGAEKKEGEPPSEYEKAIYELCDGKQIAFLGEVDEVEKVRLLRSCRALLYVTDHPEVTAHKVQEAMMCGAPVIAPRLASMPEWIEQGKTGYLCASEEEYLGAIRKVEDIKETIDFSFYSPKKVVEEWMVLYQEVKEGMRW